MQKSINKIIVRMIIVVIVIIIGYKTFQPNKEQQRAAISRALEFDDKTRHLSSRRQYVGRLQFIPLGGCPSDFREYYQSHIEAWKANDSDAIKSTWDRVIWSAYKHGVPAK